MVTFVTKAYQCANAFYYRGHQCAYGCFVIKVTSVLTAALLPRLPVCLCLLVTKFTSVHMSVLLQRLPVCLWLLVTKFTSVPMVTCDKGYQCAYGRLLTKPPVCIWLLVTKVTIVPTSPLLPRLPVCLWLLVIKVTSVPMVACYQSHQCA